MIAKRISQDDFPENGVGIVPYFYRHFGSVFSKTTRFVLKMMFFSYMA